ncbi:hypothetical protein [Teretinema zuelzerae]|nr:hypothetical protein [Teretinema zuelzerae]
MSKTLVRSTIERSIMRSIESSLTGIVFSYSAGSMNHLFELVFPA